MIIFANVDADGTIYFYGSITQICVASALYGDYDRPSYTVEGPFRAHRSAVRIMDEFAGAYARVLVHSPKGGMYNIQLKRGTHLWDIVIGHEQPMRIPVEQNARVLRAA